MSRISTRTRFTRRTALKAAGAAGALALGGASFRDATAQATPAPGEIVIPKSVAKLPTDDVTFRWIDSGDLKALFYKPFFVKYHEAHPNITVKYDPLPWTEINRIVPLGIQNGDAHDVFAMPQDIPAPQAVKEGWAAPLDDVIPNFKEWKARFPFGAFLNGVHVFDGKTYTFPVTSSKRYWTMTFYNVDYVKKAGYDPGAERFTWDTYRAAAKKITEQGQGKYYGVMIAAKAKDRLETFVRNMGRMAGATSGGSLNFDDIDWRTGDFVYTSDQYLAAIDLLLALKKDGSIYPGSLSLAAAETRARFATGVAGLLLEGPWNIPQWEQENPDFKFGLVSQPVPNSGTPMPITYEEIGSNQMWVYAKSGLKAVAGDMFNYIGSVDGQVALMAASQGNLRSIFPKAVEIAQKSVKLDPFASEALDLYDEQMRLGPMVTVRNPDAAQVAFEKRPLTPDFGSLVQGMLTGQVPDPKKAMEDLKSRSNKELDRAIDAAKKKGANVSRDDFIFPNWDPTKDYTEADYKALK